MQTNQIELHQAESTQLPGVRISDSETTGVRTETMHAIVQRSYGQAEVLKYDTLDLPAIRGQ